MTVRHVSGTIFLEGDCGVEEAEPLLQALTETPAAVVDWRACNRVHTAVVQLILATGVSMQGPCGNPWLEHWMSRIVRREERRAFDV